MTPRRLDERELVPGKLIRVTNNRHRVEFVPGQTYRIEERRECFRHGDAVRCSIPGRPANALAVFSISEFRFFEGEEPLE